MGKWSRRLISLFLLVGLGVGVGLYVHLKLLETRRAPMPPEYEEKLNTPDRVADGIVELAEIRPLAKDAPEEAARRARALIEAKQGSPEASEARLILAEVLARTGDVPGAIAQLDAVIAEPQAGPRASRARIERARLAAKADPAAARRELGAMLNDERHLPAYRLKARLELGQIEVQAGEFLQAIATLTPLTVREFPEKPAALEAIRQAVEGRAAQIAKSSDPSALFTWGDEMIKKYPELDAMRSTLRFHQGVALRQTGRFAEARVFAERLRRDDPAQRDAAVAELQRITEAEAAAGVCRDPASFLKAVAEGKETRAHADGEIAADATWTKDKGPLVLTGKVTVKTGVTLTVEAGCVVQFLLGARLVVQGTLVARGTAEAPIRFTSAAEKSPTPFDGEGIFFADSSADDRCVLEHCLVEYQRAGVACAAASPAIRQCVLARNGNAGLLAADGAEPRIEGCRIEHNDATGLRAEGASPALRRCLVLANGGDGLRFADKSAGSVEASRIRNNGGHGIACDNASSPTLKGDEIAANQGCGIRCNRFSKPLIQGNAIRDNRSTGIRCSLDSASTIAGNLIEGNRDHPLILDKSDGVIQGNTIVGNRPYGLNCLRSASPQIEGNWIEGNGGCGIIVGEASAPTISGNTIIGQTKAINTASTLTVQATGNYFGDVDDARLKDLIMDSANVTGLGEIVWRPRLTAPPPRPPQPALDLPPLP